jgi:hypothetical protein
VELHAHDRMLAVHHRHDLAVVERARHDAKRGRQTGRIDHQRVIPRDLERRRHAFEDAAAVVLDPRRLAVHRLPGTNDVAAVGLADALMSEAHAEDRCTVTEAAHDVGGNARLVRGAGAGRDDDVARRHRGHVVDRQLVAAANHGLRAPLAHVAGEVVDERVAIVENQDHQRRLASASIIERTLSSVS